MLLYTTQGLPSIQTRVRDQQNTNAFFYMLEQSKKIVFLEHYFRNTGFSFSKSLFTPQDILN